MKKILPILMALLLILPVLSTYSQKTLYQVDGAIEDLIIDVNPKQKTGYFIVMVKNSKTNNLKGVLEKSGLQVLHSYKIINALLVKGSLRDLLRVAKNTGLIKGIYKNAIFHLERGNINTGISVATATSASKIGANNLWSKGITGKGVLVAVIDTGIDKNHKDLQFANGTLKVIYEKSFVSPDYGYNTSEGPNDVEGHGTAVAGVIAGTGVQDSERGKGVAPDALLMNAKVFPKGAGATLASIIAAIEWATLGPDGQPNTGDEADVINMSIGGGQAYIDPMQAAIKRAFEYGVTVVIAAGNEGEGGISSMSTGSPGNSEYAITVGATDPNRGSVKDYSSFGPTYKLTVKPDVVAPSGVDTLAPGNSYAAGLEGTSFSCPHVAGASALLVQYLKNKSEEKIYRPSTIKVALMETALPVTGYGEIAIGAGFIRVDYAYDFLESADWDTNNVPKIWTWLPKKVPTGYRETTPFFPWGKKIFRGQNIAFNVTIITPMTVDVSFSFDNYLQNVFNVHSSLTSSGVNGIYLWEFNVTVKSETNLGDFSGNITLSISGIQESGTIEVTGTVAEAELWMLFDLAHTSWVIDSRYGQYAEFALFAEENNISIETLYFGQTLSSINLDMFDILYIPDAASYYYDYNEAGFETKLLSTNFTDEDINQIVDFVRNGGILLLSAMDPDGNNFDNLNKLTKHFGVEFQGPRFTDDVTTMTLDDNNIIANGVSRLPFYGCSLNVLSSDMVMTIGWDTTSRKTTLTGTILSNGKRAGLALITTTNFMYDNWAFKDQYDVSSLYIKNFFSNVFNYAKTLRNSMFIDLPKNTKENQLDFTIRILNGLSISAAKHIIGTTEEAILPTQINDTDYTATVNLADEGRHYVTVSFTGTYTGKMASIITVDRTAPTINSVSWSPEKPELYGNMTIRVAADDNIEINKVILSYDIGDGWVNNTMVKIGGNYTFFFDNVTFKTIKFKAIVFDTSGNYVVSDTYTVKVKIPGEAPQIPLTYVGIGVAAIVIIALLALMLRRRGE